MAFGHFRDRAIAEKKERDRIGRIALARAKAAYHCYFCESKNVNPFLIERTGKVVLLCGAHYEQIVEKM